MVNDKNIIYKIIGIGVIILSIFLLLGKKGYCEEKDYINMSKVDVLKELLETKHEVVELKQELNKVSEDLIQEKERTKMLAEKVIGCKDSINMFIQPSIEKTWQDYMHFYTKLNYITDINNHGFMATTGFMAGGFYNLWFNIDFGYNYLTTNELRLNTGIMLFL